MFDGYVTLGALEPKFWNALCRAVGREDLEHRAFEGPGSEAHRELEEIFASRTRAHWREFASEHDCCLEPVLDLDEVLGSELVLGREMVIELAQPGAERPVKLLGTPVNSEAGFGREEIAALLSSGAVAGPPAAHRGSFLA